MRQASAGLESSVSHLGLGLLRLFLSASVACQARRRSTRVAATATPAREQKTRSQERPQAPRTKEHRARLQPPAQSYRAHARKSRRRGTLARYAARAASPRLVYADGARPFPRRPRRMFVKRGMGRHDVTLICLQILCLQCLYYAMIGIWFIGGHIIFGITLHLDRFFDTHTSLDVQSMSAAFELAGVLGAGLGASYLLSVVVEKARKCLDFAVTLYDLGVTRCCGAFTPSTRVVSRNDGSGWSLFRF